MYPRVGPNSPFSVLQLFRKTICYSVEFIPLELFIMCIQIEIFASKIFTVPQEKPFAKHRQIFE